MKNVNEFFTYPADSQSVEAIESKQSYYCRFLGKKCIKQSRLIKYPIGICSVNVGDSKPIICPARFLENNTVFLEVCKDVFGSTNNILLFPEVGLKGVGTFDFVLVKHKPISNDVDDFCIVEFQSDSTTGTGALVKAMVDFIDNKYEPHKQYGFGMNTYNTIKLSYIQMLIKGQVLEKWGKQAVWVMQSFVFDNIVKRFGLSELEYENNNITKFHLYDLLRNDDVYKLSLTHKYSTTVANLLKAFTHQPTPNIDTFISALNEKIKLKIGLSF